MPSTKRYYRAKTDSLLIERLADGCVAIFDRSSRSLHSLDASASAVWEACAEGATLAEIAGALEEHFARPVEDEVLRSAIRQLQGAKLITSDEPLAAPPLVIHRRGLLRTFGAVVPGVLTFAGQLTAGGVPVTTTAAPLPTTVPPATTTAQPATTTAQPVTTTAQPTSTTRAPTTAKPTTTSRPTTPPRTTTQDHGYDHDHDHDGHDHDGHDGHDDHDNMLGA